MRRIKYLCYYNGFSNLQQRNYPLPAKNKMDYIIRTINNQGVGVDLVSCASADNTNFECQKNKRLEEGMNSLTLFRSIGGKNKFYVLLDLILIRVQLVLYLLFRVRSGEEVIVYHSMGYAYILYLVGKLKKIRYIGEIEELYQDVSKKSEWSQRAEHKFIDYCKKYIFPTQLLNERVNKDNKPYCIVHGNYKMEPQLGMGLFDDNLIHIVYGGTLDPRKGSVDAIKAAQHLPSNYHLHILGFGSPQQIEIVKRAIAETKEDNCAKVSYEGVKEGKEFIAFLQNCKIGLATQDPQASFTSTSFPSKVLTYLSNGLRVVSIDIPSIRNSSVSELISFYDSQDEKSIAKAIMEVCIEKDGYMENARILNGLDKSFAKEIGQILAL